MVDGVSSDSGSNWSSLDQTRDNYDKQKEALKEKYDESLRGIQGRYEQALHDEERSGDAAVNHIREQARYKKESAEKSAAESDEETDKQTSIKQDNLKRRTRAEDAYLKQAKDRHAAWVEGEEKELNDTKGHISQRADEQIKDIDDTNTRRIHNAEKRVAGELGKVQEEGQDRISQTREEYDKRVWDMDRREREKYRDLHEADRNQLEREQAGFSTSLRTEKQDHARELDSLRNDHTVETTKIRSETDKDVNFERNKGEKRVRDEQMVNDHNIKTERNRYEKAHSTLEHRQRESLDQLNAENEKEKSDLKGRHQFEIKRESDAYDKQINDLTQRHDSQRQALLVQQQKELGGVQEAHQQRMNGEQMEFERRFAANEDLARDTYANQGLVLGRELINQKQKFIKAADKYRDKSSDPFYQIRDNKTKLYETEGAYVFKATIPQQDRNNVHVRVKSDKVVLTGNRHFNDEISDQDKVMRTNNYQTFNEEYALPKKVKEDEIIKDYRDGVLTVTIPKV